MKYWVYKDSEIIGPFAPEDMSLAGDVGPETLVCPETALGGREADWRGVNDIPELSSMASLSVATLREEDIPDYGEGRTALTSDTLEAFTPSSPDEFPTWLAEAHSPPFQGFDDDADRYRYISGALNQAQELSDEVRRLNERIRDLEARLQGGAAAVAPAAPPEPAARLAPRPFVDIPPVSVETPVSAPAAQTPPPSLVEPPVPAETMIAESPAPAAADLSPTETPIAGGEFSREQALPAEVAGVGLPVLGAPDQTSAPAEIPGIGLPVIGESKPGEEAPIPEVPSLGVPAVEASGTPAGAEVEAPAKPKSFKERLNQRASLKKKAAAPMFKPPKSFPKSAEPLVLLKPREEQITFSGAGLPMITPSDAFPPAAQESVPDSPFAPPAGSGEALSPFAPPPADFPPVSPSGAGEAPSPFSTPFHMITPADPGDQLALGGVSSSPSPFAPPPAPAYSPAPEPKQFSSGMTQAAPLEPAQSGFGATGMTPKIEPAPFPVGGTPPEMQGVIPPVTMTYSAPALTPPGVTPVFGSAPDLSTGSQDVLSRLAKPSTATTAKKLPTKRSKLFIIAIVAAVIILSAMFWLFFQNKKEVKTLIGMGTDQRPLGVPAEQAGGEESFQPLAPPPAEPAAPPAGEVPQAAGLGAIEDPIPKAIEQVKNHSLEGNRGTIAQWFQFSFKANPSDGTQDEWGAGAVDRAIYLVEYRVLPGGADGGRMPISYLFEADLEKGTVTGRNPSAQQLLAGAPAAKPAESRSKKPSPKKRNRRSNRAASRRPVRRPAATADSEPESELEENLNLLPLDEDLDLLPPAEDDAPFLGDSVE